MIDTLRFSGPAGALRQAFRPDAINVFSTVYPNSNTERAKLAMVQKCRYHRIMYDLGKDRYHIEMNPHKALYGVNIYNYEKNFLLLHNFINQLVRVFFNSSHDVFVSRVDVGGVVDFKSFENAKNNLEEYRTTKPEGLRYIKAKAQVYDTSVFYSADNYSLKIYCKGAELRRINGQIASKVAKGTRPATDLITDDILNYADQLLRYEKTFRADELKKIGLVKEPFLGVPLSKFNLRPILEDFENTFTKWERLRKPYLTDKRGMMGVLNVLDNLGQLDNVSAQKIVSRSTISKYKSEKKSQFSELSINFENNLPKHLAKKFENTLICGTNYLFTN